MTLDSVRVRPRSAAVARRSGFAHTTRGRFGLVLASVVPLLLAVVASITVGSGDIPLDEVWAALTGQGTGTSALLITDYRLPRTVLAVATGAALALAGALMQAVTRNPLAEPGVLGVNAGAFLAVALSIALVGTADVSTYVWWAFAGAALAAVLVYAVGSGGRAGATPVKLVLAGVALTAVLNGIAQSITLTNPEIFDRIRFWQAGSLQSRGWDVVAGTLPFLVVGVLIALVLPRALNALALGDDLASALGARVGLTRVASVAAVTLLCGAATAAAGPIGFLGLMAPYVARVLVGPDQRWILPAMLTVGPTLMLASDVLGRLVVESEMPVGVVTAFLGAPLLIVLIRRSRVSGL